MKSFLNLKDFDFHLPESLIAQKPLADRDQSKLMILDRNSGSIKHEIFKNLPDYIAPQSLMVFNDTKVVPSKLNGYIIGSLRPVEVLLVKETSKKNHWEALIKGLSKIKPETEFEFGDGKLKAIYIDRNSNKAILKLLHKGKLSIILNEIARMPMPPYIKREHNDNNLEALDRERYQTIFARYPGAIAAPTAGLHFTPNTLKSLKDKGVDITHITLHVGTGTFQSIRTENIIEHKMQAEKFHISKEATKSLISSSKNHRKIIAIGSTTTRVLESIHLSTLQKEGTSGWTERYIFPGQKFNSVNHILTNFHLPKSTLYILVCAFADKKLISAAYDEAIKRKYRFFSYGDAMLII
jgi:S-adenosylmethionine:tRNA ribosyltransferase-isomerase